MAFFNKYPYTDFHELNADWVIGQTKDLLDRMDAAEAIVDAMESRVSTLEGQMTTARNNILGLQASVNSLDSRLDTQEGKMTSVEADLVEFDQHIDGLEAMDIRDMTVLVPQDGDASTIETETSVKIRLKAQSYAYGNETTHEWFEIRMPMASYQNAGMMYAAEAEVVEMLSKSGSDVKSTGGFEVTSVDTTKPHAVPDLQTVNTVTRSTIFDRDMYQEVMDPDGPIILSKFAQQSYGKLEFFQNNGQKAFYLTTPAEPQLDVAVPTSGTELIEILIPEEYRPSRTFCWDFACIDDNDNLLGQLHCKCDSTGHLFIYHVGSQLAQLSYIQMVGLYMPFM